MSARPANFHCRALLAAPLFALACAAVPAVAAPTTARSDPPALHDDRAERNPLATEQQSELGPDSSGSQRTVRMLLELQQTSTEREQPPADATRRGAAGGRLAPPASLRTAPATGTSRPNDGEPTAWSSERHAGGGSTMAEPALTLNEPGPSTNPLSSRDPSLAPTRSHLAGGDDAPGVVTVNELRLLPPGLVQFVRGNREWVLLGSIALAVVLWLLGAGAARKRH